MLTLTGAWSRCPVSAGRVNRTVICRVSCPPPGPWLAVLPSGGEPAFGLAADATEDRDVTTPGVALPPSGSVTVTASPALTRYSWPTGTAAMTTGTGEVAVAMAVPGCGGGPRTRGTPGMRRGPRACPPRPSRTRPATRTPRPPLPTPTPHPGPPPQQS